MESKEPGKIITFYSYKGGTGRSMALANIAWILASNEKKVLVMDWDLEAPGLHRYFYPFLVDKDLSSTEGLIDFVIDFAVEAATHHSGEKVEDKWYEPYADIISYAVSLKSDFGKGTLDFICAGRQGPSYSTRVNSFNWQGFYNQLGGAALLELTKQIIREEYDYILIDSRTGVSDTAGICTVQMPDKLVVCFTLNNQSIEGASAVAESVQSQRKDSAITIFPVPMRIENAEQTKRDLRLEYAQERFEQFPHSQAGEEWRIAYWKDVGVIYIPFYAYEEILAPFGDIPTAPITLLPAAERLTAYLTDNVVTQLNREFVRDREKILAQYSEFARVLSRSKVEQARTAERLFLSLSPDKQAVARRTLLRLTELGGAEETNQDRGARIPVADFDPLAREVIQDMTSAELVVKDRDGDEDEVVQFKSDALLKGWGRLRNWINQDRQFLFWRQQLQPMLMEWKSGGSKDVLLRPHLADLERWFLDPKVEFNQGEREFVKASFDFQRQKLIKSAERMFAGLKPKEQQAARRALTRMVRIVETEEVSRYASAPSVRDTRARARLSTFEPMEREVVQQMAEAHLVTRGIDAETGEEFAQLANEFLITEWERLAGWIADDRNFLIWRQEMQDGLREWEKSRRDESLLLRNDDLARAEYWIQVRRADINQAEQEFISASLDLQEREQSRAAERVYALLTTQEQEVARRVLLSMVRFGRPEEGEQDECQPINTKQLNQAERELLKVFCDARLIALDHDSRGEEMARFIKGSLLRRWNRLSNWISDDREFMLWRQELKRALGEWEDNDRSEDWLLRDLQLAPAENWLQKRQSDFSDAELEYIRASLNARGNIEKLFGDFTPEQQAAAKRALTRMVCLAPPETDGKDTVRTIRMRDLDPKAIEVVKVLGEANIVTILPHNDPGRTEATLANEILIKRWPKLKNWIKNDRHFLHWRQQLCVNIIEWEKSGNDRYALLTGKPLKVANNWLMEREGDLNESEKEFIRASRRLALWKRIVVIGSIVLVVLGVAGLLILMQVEATRERTRKENEARASELNADAREYASRGEFDTAIALFNAAVDIAPDFYESYIYRGKAFIDMQNYDSAISDLTKAIGLLRGSAEAFKWRGIAHLKKTDYEKAENDFDEAIRLDPSDSMSYDRRGRVHRARGNLDQAISDFDMAIQVAVETAIKKAIEPGPGLAEAYHDRGRAYADKYDFNLAISDYSTALMVEPLYSEAYLDLAKGFLRTGDRPGAIENFQNAYLTIKELEGRQEAEKNLRELGASIPKAAPARVFIHHQEENDLIIVDDITDRLTRRGFSVQSVTRDSNEESGEVRYFFIENEVDATYITRIIDYSLDLRKIKLSMTLKPDLDRGAPPARGTIEVWLPKLPAVKQSDKEG